jgi:xylose isomerase
MSVFEFVDQVRFEPGPAQGSRPAYRHYDAERMLLGKTMREHLRLAVCYWHTFCSSGSDMFGDALFERPWHAAAEPMVQARRKAEAAFEFFAKLGVPYYCFHDIDVAPDGATLREYRSNLAAMVDVLGAHQERSGVHLLWGTANLFSHPRYAAGAATNPDPEVFACAATQVKSALDATLQLGGANYVLWGGREGYDTLLNTNLARERRQLGRFMQMVVEHKHRIGFKGTLLIEPKPHEPTQHQYDRDVATVAGFLREFGLEREMKLNVECNHATLAGHSFHHEVAQAIALGVFGSIDANRGDPQNGWDTDQFPHSVQELTLVLYEILKSGGMGSGGFNFDAKVRRQSMDLEDLFHGHIGAIDALALALEKAAQLLQDDVLAEFKAKRYAGWDGALGRTILEGGHTLDSLAQLATERGLAPRPVSGRQEWLEGRINQVLHG